MVLEEGSPGDPGRPQPLLVLDMYGHAYAMDYGASAAKYVDAFLGNVNWEVVQGRYERGLAALAALRG